MPESLLAVYGAGQRAVREAALGGQRRVGDSGARELVAERDPRRVQHDEPCPLGGFERRRIQADGRARPRDGLALAVPGQRGNQQRPARVCGQRLDAAQVRPLRRRRQRPVERRLRAALLGRKVARDLEQRERVALPRLYDLLDHGRGKLVTEGSRKHGSGGRGVERAEPELLGVGRAVVGFSGNKECDSVDPQAPRNERNRLGRRLVQQVRVVDDHQDRSLLRHRGEKVEHAGVDGVAIHHPMRRSKSERGLERRRPRGGQACELAKQRLAQLHEGREALLHSWISATRADNPEPAGSRNGVVEQRGLSSSRLTAEHDHRAASLARHGQRAFDPSALALASEQRARRLAPVRRHHWQCADGALEVAERERVLQPAPEKLSRGLAQSRHERAVVVEESRQRSGAVPRLEQTHGLGEQLEPGLELLARRLEVTLDAVCHPPDPYGLVLVARRPCEPDGARRQCEVVRMPLADVQVGREAAEHRVATGRRGQEYLVEPELGLHPPVAVRAEGRREQLSAEADAEVREPGEHGLPDRLLLGSDPRMLVVVPHIRRGAHDDEEVVRAPVRDRLTLGRA